MGPVGERSSEIMNPGSTSRSFTTVPMLLECITDFEKINGSATGPSIANWIQAAPAV